MKLSILAGATSQSVNVFIRDSSSTTGAGLTGLAYNTASLTAYYSHAGANATATAITLATLAAVSSAYSSGGFKEIDATNMPGWYRLDLPNAVIAGSKGRSVAVHLKGATNMAPLPLEIELTGWDNQDAVRGGLTALPNVASGSAGAVITSGTGTAQLSVSSGRALSDVDTIKTQTVTCAAGVTVLASVGTAATSTAQTGDSFARLGAPAGASVSADVAAVKSDTASIKTATNTGVAPGASGGLLISGSNSGTTTLGALTVTGATTHTGLVTKSNGELINGGTQGDALKLAATTSGAGINALGVGIFPGIISTGGANASGMELYGNAAKNGLYAEGGSTGAGAQFAGGGGAATAAITLTPGGGGTVGISGNITGNITGNLSGSVGSLTANNDKTGYALSATGSAAFTEGYRADGATGTLPQLLYEVIAHLGESSITSTTKTIKKVDGTTTAATFTLDSATTPTSITRAT